MFYLVNTIHGVSPNHFGTVVSRHHTEDEASKAYQKLQRSVRRTNGRNSCLPILLLTDDDCKVDDHGNARKR